MKKIIATLTNDQLDTLNAMYFANRPVEMADSPALYNCMNQGLIQVGDIPGTYELTKLGRKVQAKRLG